MQSLFADQIEFKGNDSTGCSGTYKGFGWRIELEGNFMPEDEFPGVTQFEYYLGDDLIYAAIRD